MAMRAKTREELEQRAATAEERAGAAEERAQFWAQMAANDRKRIIALEELLRAALEKPVFGPSGPITTYPTTPPTTPTAAGATT